MTPYGAEHVADLRRRLDELLDRWQQIPESVSTGRGRPFTAPRVKYVGALAAHTFRLGRAVAVMTDAGLTVETAATVRSILEHAVTIQWVMAYGDDALFGLVNEEQRQRNNIAKSLSETRTAGQREDAQRMIASVSAEPALERSDTDAPARMFKTMCDDLDIGADVYVGYRALSGVAHPTITVAEGYIGNHEDSTINLEPGPFPEPTAWLFWTVAGLMWAARAVDMMDGQHPNRDWLRAHARDLDLPDVLKLSDAGLLRQQKDASARNRARREQEWRGPRTRN